MSKDYHASGKMLAEAVTLPLTVGEDRYGCVTIDDADGQAFCGYRGDELQPDLAAAIVAAANAFGDLLAERDALRAVLKAVEWEGTSVDAIRNTHAECCPRCGNLRGEGHAPDCALALALAAGAEKA